MTNLESFTAALVQTNERATEHPACPICTRPDWTPLTTFSLEPWVIPDVSPSDGLPDFVPTEFMEDGPDIFGIQVGFLPTVAFKCDWCGFVRFHYFDG